MGQDPMLIDPAAAGPKAILAQFDSVILEQKPFKLIGFDSVQFGSVFSGFSSVYFWFFPGSVRFGFFGYFNSAF